MSDQVNHWSRYLLLIDGLSGFTVGLLVLALREPLTELYGLPPSVVTGIGCANLLYSLGGLSFTALRTRPAPLLYGVIVANLLWMIVCLGLVATYTSTATLFGLGHIAAEGAYVTVLATLEWRNRRTLLATEHRTASNMPG